MTKLWRAREAELKLLVTGGLTIDTTFTLADQFTGSTSVVAIVKNMEIKVPEGSVEQEDYMGEDASGFQNAGLHRKPYGMATITGTFVFPGDEVFEPFAYGDGTAVSGGTYTRYRIGDGTRPVIAGLVTMDDSVDLVNFAAINSYLDLKSTKIDGPDGKFEQDFEIFCTPTNFYGPEFKD